MYFYDTFDFLSTLICFLVAIVTVPAYIYVLYILTRDRNSRAFRHTFFVLWRVAAVVDLLTLFVNYLGATFPKIGLFEDPPILYGKAYIICSWSLKFCQSTGSTAIAVNRMLAVVNANLSAKVTPNVYIALQITPGLLGAPMFFQDFYWQVVDVSYIVKFSDDRFKTRAYILSGIYFTLLDVIILWCYFVMVRKYKKMKVKMVSKFARKQERSFHVIGGTVSGVELVQSGVLMYKTLLGGHIDTNLFYTIINIVTHLYCCLSPFLLLGFSKSLRLRATEGTNLFFTRRKKNIERSHHSVHKVKESQSARF